MLTVATIWATVACQMDDPIVGDGTETTTATTGSTTTTNVASITLTPSTLGIVAGNTSQLTLS